MRHVLAFAALLVVLPACPSDPTFVIGDAATVTDVAATDASGGDTVGAEDATTAPDAVACAPACGEAEYCSDGACRPCSERCAAFYAQAMCGFNDCGVLCACGGAVACGEGDCPCADATCQVAVQPGNADVAAIAFGPQGAPSIVLAPRAVGGTLLFSRWDGLDWEVRDTGIPYEPGRRPTIAVSPADDVWIVRSAELGEARAYRRAGSEWLETQVVGGSCGRSAIHWDAADHAMAVTCGDDDQRELQYYVSDGDAWVPQGTPLSLGLAGAVEDLATSLDKVGRLQVAWLLRGEDHVIHVQYALRNDTTYDHDEVATFDEAQEGFVVTITGARADPQILWTQKVDGMMDLVHAWREGETWRTKTVFHTDWLGPRLSAAQSDDGEVHVAFDAGHDPIYLATRRGVVGVEHAPALDDDLASLGLALDGRGVPRVVWTDVVGHARLWSPRSLP